MRPVGGSPALTAAVTTLAAARLLSRRAGQASAPPDRWRRTNYRGRTVTLAEGPAVVAGLLAGVLAAGLPCRCRWAALAATGAAGALGALDDLAGSPGARGLRGHLRALRHGQVTTGVVKLAGLGVTGLLATHLASTPRRNAGAGRSAGAATVRGGTGPGDLLLGGFVVAGSANLVNLFDLRPGRALKVAALAAVPLAVGADRMARGTAAAVLGAVAAALPEDLSERGMLGDTGANALGALLGLSAVVELARGGRGKRIAVAVGIAALTLTSEKISFSEVIEKSGPLRRLDRLGRLPS